MTKPPVNAELQAYREECVWVLLVLGTDIRWAQSRAFAGRLRLHRRRVGRYHGRTSAMATCRWPSSLERVVCRWRARTCPPGVRWRWPSAAGPVVGRRPPSLLSLARRRPAVRYGRPRTAKPPLLLRRRFGGRHRRFAAATGRYPAACCCRLAVRATLWRPTTETNLSTEQHIITRYAQVKTQRIFKVAPRRLCDIVRWRDCRRRRGGDPFGSTDIVVGRLVRRYIIYTIQYCIMHMRYRRNE